MTITPTQRRADEQAAEEFAGRLFEMFTGGVLTYLIDIGRRTDLFAAAAVGPATCAELARRSSLDERYVREWLGAMTTSGIIEYNAANGHYWLPAEHAVCLTGTGVQNMTPVAYLTTVLTAHSGGPAAAPPNPVGAENHGRGPDQRLLSRPTPATAA